MTLRTVTAMLAHQGGWDEVLVVMIVPLVLFALLSAAARRKGDDADRDRDGDDG